jgi:hypothetical protein
MQGSRERRRARGAIGGRNNATLHRREGYLSWGAMLSGVVLTIAVWLNNQTRNDQDHALGTGFAVDPADPFLHRLYDAAVANRPPSDVWCTGCQLLILSDLHFNYPIFGLFGSAQRLPPLLRRHPSSPVCTDQDRRT